MKARAVILFVSFALLFAWPGLLSERNSATCLSVTLDRTVSAEVDSYVADVAFDRNAETVYWVESDDFVHRWNLKTGQTEGILKGRFSHMTRIAISEEGGSIAGCGIARFEVWDISTEQQHLGGKGGGKLTALALSRRGDLLACGGGGAGRITVWDLKEKRKRHFLATIDPPPDWVWDLVFTPDGKHMVSGHDDGTVRVWNMETGDREADLRGHSQSVHGVWISPDAKTVVSASFDGTIRTWDVVTGLGSILKQGANACSVDVSPSGALFVTGNGDGTLRFWNHAESAETVIEAHKSGVTFVGFSQNGRLLVSASSDGVKLWKITDR